MRRYFIPLLVPKSLFLVFLETCDRGVRSGYFDDALARPVELAGRLVFQPACQRFIRVSLVDGFAGEQARSSRLVGSG